MAHRLEANGDPRSGDAGGDESNRIGRRSCIRLGAAGMLALVTGASRVAATDPSPESADRPDRRLLVAGGRDGARYEITVDGRLVPGQGATADAGRRISGSSTEGVVVDGARRYRFSGEVRDLAVRGDAGVYVGTEQVYPD